MHFRHDPPVGIDDAMEDAGVDPDFTPTDRVPEQGLWAIRQSYMEQNGESDD